MTEAKGMAVAEISRGFFGVQLHYADVLAAKAGVPLGEAVTFHTNFHRLFAYGNLSKMAPDAEFVALVGDVVAIGDAKKRLDLLIAAFAKRPADPWPSDRFPFGPHFACEAPNEAGAVKIHFRNRYNDGSIGPLHASRTVERRRELTAMFGFVAKRWPEAKTVNGASWLYNTEGYRRLFPLEYGASRMALFRARA